MLHCIAFFGRIDTDDCDWYSCGEWCLSKSSHCVKLWAQVRKNGSEVLFSGCTNVRDITCMVRYQQYTGFKIISGGKEAVIIRFENDSSSCNIRSWPQRYSNVHAQFIGYI